MKKFEQILIAALLLITFSCSKNNDNDSNINDEISFTISFSDLSQSLKSISLNDSFPTLEDAKQIVLTIKTINGEDTKYVSEKIEIFKMNGTYFSQKLSLVTGNYKLTEFFLIDSANNTIFATPLIGSQQAQNVDYPLPIEFSIAKDQISSVNVEVLSTTGLSPADFGLVGFIFHEVPTFSFFINVSEKGQMDSLLTAPIIITNGTYTLTQTITCIVNNVITIRDGYPEYIVSISKEGYLPFENTFSVDSLKQFAEIPLTIELEKEAPETVTDIDGNLYHTVKIGNQVWMVENLKVTHYNDGTTIPNITDLSEWAITPNGAYCIFNNGTVDTIVFGHEIDVATYGLLYNWAACTQNICPQGWHIPTRNEIEILINYLGNTPSQSLREAGTDHWKAPNEGATNSSGFTALPGGVRFPSGVYNGFGGSWGAYFWTSTYFDTNKAYYLILSSANGIPYAYDSIKKNFGLSIRCIKD